MTSGPKRLLESGDAGLARSLGAARDHLPSPERLAAIGERLAELGLPTTEPSGVKTTPDAAPSPPAPPPSSSLLLKGVAGALATGGVVLTLALTLPGRETAEPAPSKVPAAAVVTTAPEPDAAPAQTEASALRAPQGQRTPPELRAEVPDAPPSATPPRATLPSGPVPRSPDPAAARAPAARKAPEVAAAPAPTNEVAPPVESDPPPVAQATTGESSAGTSELRRGPVATEVELLKEARRALSSDPERALSLTRRYGAEYPHGTYAQERDFIAISALSRLGRGAEAKARGEAFRARYPRSAYLPQLGRLLGER